MFPCKQIADAEPRIQIIICDVEMSILIATTIIKHKSGKHKFQNYFKNVLMKYLKVNNCHFYFNEKTIFLLYINRFNKLKILFN